MFVSHPSPLSLLGVLFDLLAILVMSKKMDSAKMTVFFSLLALHIFVSVVYYQYTVDYTADAPLYYFDRGRMSHSAFAFGTVFLARFTQFMKNTIGGTYFDYFLLFQAFGFWGIILMARSFEEIRDHLGIQATGPTIALLYFPGLHFWTSALGKDAPILLATSLATWAALKLRTRALQFAIALAIMVLIRPHVALIAVMALAFAALFHSRGNALAKFGLLTLALAGVALIAPTVQSSFGVDLSNANSITDWIASKQQIGVSMAGQTSAVGGSFPVRLLSLLFRPMFFDANGVFGLIASVENVCTVAIIAFLVRSWRQGRFLMQSVFFVRFALIFWLLLCILLAMVYYNVGLGLRQKTMFMPPFFCFFVAQWAWQRRLQMTPFAAPPTQQNMVHAPAAAAIRNAQEAPR